MAGGNGVGSETRPKAFVNILLFDKDHKFLDIAFEQIDGGEQVGVSPNVPHDYMSREVVIKEAGYAYVYLSNENATYVEVYFDDIKVTYTPTNLLQYNEYYPFGLTAANSWTRDGNSNNFLYNAGAELNTTTQWYEMFFRGYDAALGRMFEVDPKASLYGSMTPYNYAFNDPVTWNDPLGDSPIKRINHNTWVINWDKVKEDKKYTWHAEDAHAGPSDGIFGDAYDNMNNWNMLTYGSTEGAGGKTSYGGFGMSYHGSWVSERGGMEWVWLETPTEPNSLHPGREGKGMWVAKLTKKFVVERKPRVTSQAQQNNPNIIYVYSPDQVGRIRNANDGLALYIAMYGVNNQFVDGKGNPSNYAERLFKKTHPNSKISFPANGNSAQFVPGGSLDIMIKGLNFKTGQFDDLRTIHIQSDRDRTDALMRGIFEVIMEHGADYLIEKIFRLPPIILPPGYFNDPLGPPNQGG